MLKVHQLVFSRGLHPVPSVRMDFVEHDLPVTADALQADLVPEHLVPEYLF